MIPFLLKLGLYGCLDKMPDVLPPEEGGDASSLTNNDPGGVPDLPPDSPPEENINKAPKITDLKRPPNVVGIDSCFETGNFFEPTFMVTDPEDDPVGCSVDLYNAENSSEPLETVKIPVDDNDLKIARFDAASLSPFKPGYEGQDTFYIQATCTDDQGATTTLRFGDFPILLAEEECGDSDRDGLINIRDNCPDNPSSERTDSDGDGVGDVCDHSPVIRNRFPEEGDFLLPEPTFPNLTPGWGVNSHIPFEFEVRDNDEDLKTCTITRTNKSTDETVSKVVEQESFENPLSENFNSVNQDYPATEFQPITDYCWTVSCEDRAGNVSVEGGESCFYTSDFGLVLWLRFKDRNNLGHDSSGFGNHATVNVNRQNNPPIDRQLRWTDGQGIDGANDGELNGGGIIIPLARTTADGVKIAGGSISFPHFSELNPQHNFSVLIRFLSTGDIQGAGLMFGGGGSWNFVADDLGRPVCTVNPDGGQVRSSTPFRIGNDILHNALCVYDENQVRVQIGAVSAGTRAEGVLVQNPTPISIGINHRDEPLGDTPLIGILDEVLFYDRAITQAEGNRLFCILDHGAGPTCR